MADARVLTVLLGNVVVGHLTGHREGRNVFTFEEAYINAGPARPVLGLAFNHLNDEPATERHLREVAASRMKLPPWFSNLLPEGVLREYLVSRLRIHRDHEFDLLMALGESLPGAVRALPADGLPRSLLHRPRGTPVTRLDDMPIKFSLGGAQLKFAMVERGGRYTIGDSGGTQWLVKPPHTLHAHVPLNEYTMMRLAAAAGVETPEVRLLKVTDVNVGGFDFPGGPKATPPRGEKWAYAVRRYDRTPAGRVHAEDFAQVFNVYAEQEYTATNYDTIGRLIFDLFPNRFEQLAEFIRRSTVNLLIGNGDAHLKNWSVIYRDKLTPQLAPAYDLVSTIQYVANDSLALNLGGAKQFTAIDETHFDRLARRINAPPKYVLEVVRDTVAAAQEKWPDVIKQCGLPAPFHKRLREHWRTLSPILQGK